ncbi:hypothetical protein A3K72_03065 [Candidatus Woesearchaeota archaeon RBG_13_36_6]|nr:MAG: hypothetical protein A3K72_03065 [Candidatus Woesearchaeota archaeon RBG_13_36_6]
MIKKVCDKIWKVSADSNVYFLDFDEKIVIDTGNRAQHNIIEQFLSKVVDFDKVEKVVFTHLHYDHIGNFDFFPNAKFYASQQEIDDFKKDPLGTVLREDIAKMFTVELHPIRYLNKLEIINTPGHTRGSICLWYEKEKLLFSGDTIFKKGSGRTDLPTSDPKKQRESMIKLLNYNYKILCPGHDY